MWCVYGVYGMAWHSIGCFIVWCVMVKYGIWHILSIITYCEVIVPVPGSSKNWSTLNFCNSSSSSMLNVSLG